LEERQWSVGDNAGIIGVVFGGGFDTESDAIQRIEEPR